MKYFKNYFTLVLLVLLSSSNMHAQLFGGQVRAKKPASIVIPANITLAQNRMHFIASINDSDYLPYLPATTAATTDTNVAADGTAEGTTINVQGTLTTTGVTVQIPVTASGTGTLPAFSTIVNIPAELTEDGIARDVTLSWASQGYTATTTFITATIAAVGGTLNAKKLDINSGIGNDALGVLMASLTYPYNNAGATTTYQIRDIAGIPDRNFGVATTQGAAAGTSGEFHNFLYLPTVAEDGRIWLNHNLGADYTNLNSVHFNPGQQATSTTDFKAYGSFYQWGRLTDGHELFDWTGSTTGSGKNANTTTLSSTDVPGNRLFILAPSVPADWRSPQNANLWQGVTGVNNPCPQGFRIPTQTEFTSLVTAAGISDTGTDVKINNSSLKFTFPSLRNTANTIGVTGANNPSTTGRYWTSTVSGTQARIRLFAATTTGEFDSYRGHANSIRCIQEPAPPATLTIDCDGKTSAGTLTVGAAASGVTMSIPYTGGNSGWLAGSSATSTGVSGLTATFAGSNNVGTTGNIVFTITGTPASTGTANFSVTVNGVVCAFSLTVNNITIPANITLAQSRMHFIASINDSDYLPYQPATTAATTDTNVAADGVAEATVINVQGTLTTTGVTVQIPVTASGTGTLPAFSTTVNIPAEFTEDGIARDVRLSWASQGYTATTRFITATIAAVGGTLNAKKLDINSGIGNDALGILMGTLNYPYNNAGATTTYQIRDIASIPDKNFGVTTTQGTGAGTSGQFHNFLYLPTVAEDGRIWLNHNLGADYTNLNNANFNPGQKATSGSDFRAYGSLFQWGRLSDGHELINWTSNLVATAVNSTTTTLSTTNVPSTRLFINNPNSPQDWRSGQNANLWQGVTGINNPCPTGFRVPTATEYSTLITAANITNDTNTASTILALTSPGNRSFSDGILSSFGSGNYWTSTTSSGVSTRRLLSASSTSSGNTNRGFGFSVRCIQETAAPATLTIDCDGKTSAGTLTTGVAASSVSVSIPYTGGNSGWLAGSSATSTGVSGLTATYAGSNNVGTTGNIVFTITGTPVGIGTATFALNVGGQSCSASFSVSYPAGTGSLSGKTCFDIALGNNNSNGCGPLSARTANQSDFTLAATHTQSYIFTPNGTVSNVRFVFVNTNGDVISAISGNNTGNNISTAVTATVNYNTNLNTLAAGLTSFNPLTADIFVIYNDGATNNGVDRQLKLTVNVKDCACCIAKISPTVSKEFLCHNLGANTSLDPHNMAQTNAWGLNGAYIQWGRRGPNTTGDSRVDWVTAANTANFAAAPSGNTEETANSNAVDNWSQTSAGNAAWVTAGGVKTANDPCPAGWRVPTQAEWIGVDANNTKSVTSPWSSASNTQYGNALHYGPNTTTKLLTLPAAGYRGTLIGDLQARGQDGYYWASTALGTESAGIGFDQFTVCTNCTFTRVFGASVRCIAQ